MRRAPQAATTWLSSTAPIAPATGFGTTAVQGVLDWEDAHRGDPLEDLATARLDVWIRFGAEAVATFTTAYRAAASHVDTRRLAAYDRWAADHAVGRVVRWTGDPVERARLTAATGAFGQDAQRSPPE